MLRGPAPGMLSRHGCQVDRRSGIILLVISASMVLRSDKPTVQDRSTEHGDLGLLAAVLALDDLGLIHLAAH